MGKIIIVNPYQLFRAALIQLFQQLDDYTVVADAETGEEAIQLVRQIEPDLVLLDINMGGIGGIETIKRIKRIQQDTKILVVTTSEASPYPSMAIKAGAEGFVSLHDSDDNLMRAVRTIMSGQNYITSHIAQEMAMKSYVEYNSPFETLSERELQVMSLITQCYRVKDIAQQLYLSPKTVNTYRYRIYGKLGVDSDVGMTIMAMRHGMLSAYNGKRSRG